MTVVGCVVKFDRKSFGAFLSTFRTHPVFGYYMNFVFAPHDGLENMMLQKLQTTAG